MHYSEVVYTYLLVTGKYDISQRDREVPCSVFLKGKYLKGGAVGWLKEFAIAKLHTVVMKTFTTDTIHFHAFSLNTAASQF
jgi:hypothetical protein